MLKPWYGIPIIDNKEELTLIPSSFKFINPHPYLKLGAPYKNKNFIWVLRKSVVDRLIMANNYLQKISSDYSLIIYDSWRPLEVQSFMFYSVFKDECRKRNLNIPFNEMNAYPEILEKVNKFWAYPHEETSQPPPHSTGGAIDIGLSDDLGNLVEMGCEIDFMDKTAKPDYYNKINSKNAILWNSRRKLLKKIMIKFGFVQHPNEWWHFSYGDQLWAWKNKNKNAIYGKKTLYG